MSALTDLLERHVPYIPASDAIGLQCHECLDGRGAGEFATTAAWALHIEAELKAAGLKVTRRAAADDEATGALF